MNLNLLDFFFYLIIAFLIFSIIEDIIKQISINRALKKMASFGDLEKALLCSFILDKKNVTIETTKDQHKEENTEPEIELYKSNIDSIGDHSNTTTKSSNR